MNTPSIKTISQKLGLDPDKAKQIKGLMNGSIDPETFESVKYLIGCCYNPPDSDYMLMVAFDEILEGYGLEYLDDKQVEYVNMGDSYVNTICLQAGRFTIKCWGDIYK